jgi:hypothetical protein
MAQRKFIVVKSFFFGAKIKKSYRLVPPDWRVDGVQLFVTKAIHIMPRMCPSLSDAYYVRILIFVA